MSAQGLLRSVIDFEETLSQDNLVDNFRKLSASNLEWARPEDKKIFDFLKSYFQLRLEMPSKATLVDYFETAQDVEAQERVKDIEKSQPYIRSNFSHLLASTLEEQYRLTAVQLYKQGAEIATKGLMVDGEKQIGVQASIIHVTSSLHKLSTPNHNSRLRGELREDAPEVLEEYLAAKANKGLAYGRFTGINNIDKVCHGAKKGELWMHAGYAGELKTTFSTNWCYNLVTRYRSNVFYVSLEMTYEHIRRLIYVIHSANARFKLQGYKPLDYRRVRDGELTEEEELFYRMVVADFNENEEYGRFEVWRPADLDVTMDDIKMEAELTHNQTEIGLIVVDHGGLVEPRKRKRSKDPLLEANSVIRDAKKLALNFNGGESIPTLLLFQINRQGKDEADKNEGRYKSLKALAYANEAERSADIVTTTYLNEEHRKNGTTVFSNLKNRDNPLFDSFIASMDFSCRRLTNQDPFAGTSNRGMSMDDQRTVIDGMFGV